MADPIISQEVNIEMLEKLADGTFKKKNPATKASQVKFNDGTTVESHKDNVAIHQTMAIGSYTGNQNQDSPNDPERIIVVGFTPRLVIIRDNDSLEATTAFLGNAAIVIKGDSLHSTRFTKIVEGGFRLRDNNANFLNKSGWTYTYVAFK